MCWSGGWSLCSRQGTKKMQTARERWEKKERKCRGVKRMLGGRKEKHISMEVDTIEYLYTSLKYKTLTPQHTLVELHWGTISRWTQVTFSLRCVIFMRYSTAWGFFPHKWTIFFALKKPCNIALLYYSRRINTEAILLEGCSYHLLRIGFYFKICPMPSALSSQPGLSILSDGGCPHNGAGSLQPSCTLVWEFHPSLSPLLNSPTPFQYLPDFSYFRLCLSLIGLCSMILFT